MQSVNEIVPSVTPRPAQETQTHRFLKRLMSATLLMTPIYLLCPMSFLFSRCNRYAEELLVRQTLSCRREIDL